MGRCSSIFSCHRLRCWSSYQKTGPWPTIWWILRDSRNVKEFLGSIGWFLVFQFYCLVNHEAWDRQQMMLTTEDLIVDDMVEPLSWPQLVWSLIWQNDELQPQETTRFNIPNTQCNEKVMFESHQSVPWFMSFPAPRVSQYQAGNRESFPTFLDFCRLLSQEWYTRVI